MKVKPLIFVWLSAIYVAIAISFPLQIMVAHEHQWSEFNQALGKLTFLNWLVIIGLGVASYYSYQGSRRIIPTATVLGILVLVNNLYVGAFGEDFSLIQTLGAFVGFGLLHTMLLQKDVVRVLNNQNLRWWRISPRQSLRLPVLLRNNKTTSITTETVDISESGIFVRIEQSKHLGPRAFKMNEIVQIQLKLDTINSIKCSGRVVRHCFGEQGRPMGIALEFKEISSVDRKRIMKLLNPEKTAQPAKNNSLSA